jgi:hypothetical protein
VTRGLAAIALACLLASLPAAGCSYTTRSLVDESYQTVAIPIFANDTPRRDLEIEVTRAVVEEMQARTHLRVVPEGDSPDLVLRGTLHEVDEQGVSRRKFQRIREQDVFVTAEVTVENRRTGKDLVPKRLVTEREAFVPVIGEDVRTAREEAVRALAERVVRTLESSW